MGLKAVVFDMDGTITKPVLNFKQIRQELNLSHEGDIAELILELSDAEQEIAWKIIYQHEQEAMNNQTLQPGFLDVLALCRQYGLKVGVITRNISQSVEVLCEKFDLTFDHVMTRECEYIKPHPGPLLFLLKKWKLKGEEAIMIGDYIHDVECANRAGALSCYFFNPGTEDFSAEADFTITEMSQLSEIINIKIEHNNDK